MEECIIVTGISFLLILDPKPLVTSYGSFIPIHDFHNSVVILIIMDPKSWSWRLHIDPWSWSIILDLDPDEPNFDPEAGRGAVKRTAEAERWTASNANKERELLPCVVLVLPSKKPSPAEKIYQIYLKPSSAENILNIFETIICRKIYIIYLKPSPTEIYQILKLSPAIVTLPPVINYLVEEHVTRIKNRYKYVGRVQ